MIDENIDRLETILGRLLLAGVLCSSALLLVGLIIWMLDVAPAVSTALLNAGLVTLIATPLLRVFVSLVEYIRMRDWYFVLTTLAVLTVLLVSIGLAMTER